VNTVVVGINHQTAPLSLRERLYVSDAELRTALTALQSENLREIVGVSTCNRLEIYACAADSEAAAETISGFLARRAALPLGELTSHLQVKYERDAVQHLMRVAAGLESPILGETEILGQVADALREAQAADTVGAVLTRLFQDAIRTGKRARNETAISRHTLSVSHAAVLLAKAAIDLSEARALVVGAGQMAEGAARALRGYGVAQLGLVNRTFAKGAITATKTGAIVIDIAQFERAVCDAQVIILATSAPNPILSAEHFKNHQRPVVIVDIGMPRNAHQNLRDLPNVTLFDLDDAQRIVDEHRALRESQIAPVEAIIAEEAYGYFEWLESRGAVSTIVALYGKADEVIESELGRAFRRLPDLSDYEREVLATMAHRIANKLLHAPAAALRDEAGSEAHLRRLEAARELFDVETEAERD
jgi:glutamyl-tRNA reductase